MCVLLAAVGLRERLKELTAAIIAFCQAAVRLIQVLSLLLGIRHLHQTAIQYRLQVVVGGFLGLEDNAAIRLWLEALPLSIVQAVTPEHARTVERLLQVVVFA